MNVDRLNRIPLFEGLDDGALREVALIAGETSAGAEETIVRCGDFAYELAVIDEGEVRVEFEGDEPQRLGPGGLFGELGVLGKSTRTATVVAETDCRLITLSAWDIRRLRSRFPQVVERIEQVAALRQRQPLKG